MTYALDQDWPQERARLAAMEDLWDPGTKIAIEALGINRGWRCLEVGAGAGSIATWLADRVGRHGEVLATDLTTRHLDGVARSNLEVREHDIVGDPLPEEHFDLAHARLLVEHLGSEVLDRLIAPLRPGGWLVIEDHDWAGFATYPDSDGMRRVIDGVAGHLARSGFDAQYGRRMVHDLRWAGLDDVGAEGRARVFRGASSAAAFLRLTLNSLQSALLEHGDVAGDDLEHAYRRLDDPDAVFVTAAMIAAWGRRPGV
jgi:SAM-dependent methyltransferase